VYVGPAEFDSRVASYFSRGGGRAAASAVVGRRGGRAKHIHAEKIGGCLKVGRRNGRKKAEGR
jgi:hypothetical protein